MKHLEQTIQYLENKVLLIEAKALKARNFELIQEADEYKRAIELLKTEQGE